MSVFQRDYTHYPMQVEYRPSMGMYFVVFPTENLELAPAFKNEDTAREIGVNCFMGIPFFKSIPTVQYGTPFPRPDIPQPRHWRLLEHAYRSCTVINTGM